MKDYPEFAELIVGEQLSSVEFVQDYLQLHFDGPTITLFVWPIVKFRDGEFRFQSSGYRDALCSRIAHIVKAASLRGDEALHIEFDDGTRLSVSLQAEVTCGKEAGYFCAHKHNNDPLVDF